MKNIFILSIDNHRAIGYNKFYKVIALRKRGDKMKYKRITVIFRPVESLYNELKSLAIADSTDMSKVMEIALKEYIGKRKIKLKKEPPAV